MIFPPAFLDSSSCWNTNHNQLQPLASNNITSPLATAAGGDHEGNNHPHDGLATALGGGGGGGDGGAADGPAKPMSMSERARLARVPQPEPGLNCPRCDSTNTKFCYFNNYSLTQPRHFCRACRRYWTRGGALRNVPVGGGYRRHAKRAKPKATSSAAAAGPGAPTSTTPAGTCTAAAPSSLQAMLSNSAPPPSHRFADFDPASLGLSFPGAARLLFADTADAYAGGGNVHQGMEQQQWAQMQSFTLLHAMDHQMGPPATAMPATMAMQGMFHLGLQSGGGNGEDGGEQFHATPAKRDQQQDYPTSRGMYGDVNGYTFYSSSSAAGN